VAQASSSWQQLINQIPSLTHGKLNTKNQKQSIQRFRGPGGYLGLLTIVVAMLFWNWKLLLALFVGVGVMVLVYSMYRWDWQTRWSEVYTLLNSQNSRLVLAVGSGAIACVISYMAAAIWVESSSRWIAAGAIVQGICTLLTLILLVWQIVSFYVNREDDTDKLLIDLTHEDPLKRLITIRQLAKLITRKNIDSRLQQNIFDCLRLLISREEETIVREAAFESLQALDHLQAVSSNPIPLVRISMKANQQAY
jgi:membrane protein implicated in regulation of membrane protease activity